MTVFLGRVLVHSQASREPMRRLAGPGVIDARGAAVVVSHEAAPMLDATRESSPCDSGTGIAFPSMRNDCSVTPLHVAYWHFGDMPNDPENVC